MREFYEERKHKKKLSQAYVKNDFYGDMLVDISDFEKCVDPQFMVSIANQVIFMNSTKGAQIHYKIDKIPNRRFLEDVGLKPEYGYVKFYLSANDTSILVEQAQKYFQISDINIQIKNTHFSEIDLRIGKQFLQFNFTINDWVMRAIAKMIFNYFVWQYGAVVYGKDFNDIRNYVSDLPGFLIPKLHREISPIC